MTTTEIVLTCVIGGFLLAYAFMILMVWMMCGPSMSFVGGALASKSK